MRHTIESTIYLHKHANIHVDIGVRGQGSAIVFYNHITRMMYRYCGDEPPHGFGYTLGICKITPPPPPQITQHLSGFCTRLLMKLKNKTVTVIIYIPVCVCNNHNIVSVVKLIDAHFTFSIRF